MKYTQSFAHSILTAATLFLALGVFNACSSSSSSEPAQPPAITTTSLSQADAEVPLPGSFVLEASGTGPLAWVVANGTLPAGVTLAASGALVGTPTQEGQFLFTAQVTGPGGTDSREFKLAILGATHRVSVISSTSSTNPLGEANGPSGNHSRSFDPGISGNGRFVVFDSVATNLDPDKNPQGKRQVYLHDRQTGLTEMVSVNDAGIPGDDDSFVAVVSDDGNIVVFDSFATNFAVNDTNSARDVFLRDRAAGTTQRISQLITGDQGICTAVDPLLCNSFDPSISADGQVIAFGSYTRLTSDDTDTFADVYVYDRRVPSLKRISTSGVAPNGDSGSPAISADGHVVAFSSTATNLIPSDTDDPYDDIYVFDLRTNAMRKAYEIAEGAWPTGPSFGPSISGDGRFVAFWSEATNLMTDNNTVPDVFIADMQDPTNELKMVVELLSGNFEQADGPTLAPSISRDGKIIAFQSLATNLDSTPVTPGVQNIYVLDRSCSPIFGGGTCNTLKQVSVASDGSASNGESRYPALSGDGKYIAYYSDANNLVPSAGDQNMARDAFVSRRR